MLEAFYGKQGLQLPAGDASAEAIAIPAEVKKIEDILSGRLTIGLHMEFLFRNNKTDLAILKNTKTAIETRNIVSVFHNATICSHGLMHAGTSVDQFLRDNLEWLGRANNWSKFSAIASLGVIHRVTKQNLNNFFFWRTQKKKKFFFFAVSGTRCTGSSAALAVPAKGGPDEHQLAIL